jgi:hypothetical protein
MRNEEFGIGALEDNDADLIVIPNHVEKPDDLGHQPNVENIHRWIIDGDRRHAGIFRDVQSSKFVCRQEAVAFLWMLIG